MGRRRVAGVALAAALIAAGAAHHASAEAAHGHMPDGTTYTRVSWARALLTAGGWQQTACNTGAVTAWEAAEASDPAWRNPLDTTQREPGSHPVNQAGVQEYPTWQDGFRATITTLHNGLYRPVLAALTAGNDAQAVADAVAGSRWGTGPFTASCS
jgi:hypothetical protein